MPHFLFVADVPPLSPGAVGAIVSVEWMNFENGAKSILKNARSTKQIMRNVWLLPAENSLPVLTGLTALAQSSQVACCVLLVGGDITEMGAIGK